MKDNKDKQRKYSLRKSKQCGLALAVIGIVCFGNGIVSVSADSIADSDNDVVVISNGVSDKVEVSDSTAVSSATSKVDEASSSINSNVGDVEVISKTEDSVNLSASNVETADVLDGGTVSKDLVASTDSVSDIDNLIKLSSVNAVESTPVTGKELDSSKVNVSYDSVNKRIDIAFPDDLVVSEGDTVTFTTNNLSGNIISTSRPTINDVSVADISYKEDTTAFNNRRREFLKKVDSSNGNWKTITQEEIVNAYNDLLNHERQGTYTVRLKESLNGLVGRHIYIPINANNDGSVGVTSVTDDLLMSNTAEVSRALYETLPSKEGVIKESHLRYNGKDVVSISPYNYKVDMRVRKEYDTTDGATILTYTNGGYSFDPYYSNYSRVSADSFNSFYSSPTYKAPLESPQYFRAGDIKISLSSDMYNIGNIDTLSNSHVSSLGGYLWNMDAPLPETITFKKSLANNNTLAFSNDGSLSKYESNGSGSSSNSLDIVYKVEKVGGTIILTNTNEFVLPEGSDPLIYTFNSSDFTGLGQGTLERFKNNETPFLNPDLNEFPGTDLFDTMTILRDYFEDSGTLKGTSGNYYREYSFKGASGNNGKLEEFTSAKLTLNIRDVESPNSVKTVTVLSPVKYRAYLNSNVDNSALGTETGTVNVHYVDTEGNKIQDSKSLGTKTFDTEYSVKPSEETITGWNYLKIASNSSPLEGTYGNRVEDVILVYERVKSPVIANYYKDGTTEKLAESDDQGKRSVDSNYTTVSKTIEPKIETIDSPERTITRKTTYTLKEVPSNATGKVPLEGVVVNYYYIENVTETVTPKQAPVIANYYKDGTTEKLADSDNQGQKDINSSYTTVAKSIEPKVETVDSPERTVTRTTTYELKAMPSNATGTVPVGGVVVDYYYVEKVTEASVSKQAPVVANYYKDGTTDKLADSDNQGMKDISSNYTTSAKSIEPKVETIDSPDKVVTRTTTYTLKETPSNAKGTVPVGGAVVNYYYVEKVTETVTPKKAPVIANYYKDGTTEKLADSDNQGDRDISSKYTTSAKSIEPKVETIDSPDKVVTRTTTYTLKETPTNAEGTVPVGGAVVNYYYVEKVTETSVSKQAPVVANYYKDGTTDKLADSDNQGMKDISSKYTTSAKSIEPKVETVETDSKTVVRTTTYTLKEVPSNAEGTVPVGGAVVNYYYVEKVTETSVNKQAPVVANYYKDGTTDKLADSDNQGMKDIASSYTTVSKSIKPKVETIDSPDKVVTRTTTYELKEVPSNAKGTVPVGGVEVNYYYVEKVTETSVSKKAPVVANYYKDGTTDKLADSDDQGMKDINSAYTTSAKTIKPKVETFEKDGGTITRTTTFELKEVPNNANGSVPIGGVVVNYYYVEKVTETKVPSPEEPKVPETPKPEVPKVPSPEEPKVPETPKPEVPKVPSPEVPKVPSPEVPKVPSPEVPKVPETPKPEEPKVPSPEVPKVPETPRSPETPKREEPKSETPKSETPKSETPKSETPKSETPRSETPRSETPKRDELKGITPVSASTEQLRPMSRVADRHELPNTGDSDSLIAVLAGIGAMVLALIAKLKSKFN